VIENGRHKALEMCGDNRIIFSRTQFGLNTQRLQMVRDSIWRRARANNAIRAVMFLRPAAPDAVF